MKLICASYTHSVRIVYSLGSNLLFQLHFKHYPIPHFDLCSFFHWRVWQLVQKLFAHKNLFKISDITGEKSNKREILSRVNKYTKTIIPKKSSFDYNLTELVIKNFPVAQCLFLLCTRTYFIMHADYKQKLMKVFL